MPINSPGFDFASRDYENIKRDLIRRAERVIPEWTDRDPADFTMMLIDLWAYMGDIFHYYIDRAAGEAFIETATQKESVLALANLFDYTPRNRSAAKVTVYVSNSGTASTTVPAGTVFIGSGTNTNYEYYTTVGASVGIGQTVAVSAYEGKTVVEEVLTNNASGQIGQVYTISNDKVVPSTVQVYVYEDGVNPVAWTQVANVNLIDTGISGFSTYSTSEGYTSVVFGNRINGRIPPTGSKITVSYSTTNGDEGNIGVNKILGFKTSPPMGLSVTSSSSGVGGSSGEDIESIKRSIKAVIQTQSRAVTLQDYVDFALQLSGVYKAVASYNMDIMAGPTVTLYLLPYIADYQNYSTNTISIDSNVALLVSQTLQSISMVGVNVTSASSVTVRPKDIEGTVYINPSYVVSDVMRKVYSSIDALFSIENIEFGKDVRIGDLYRRIHSIEGVDYATLTVVGTAPTQTQVIRKGTVNLTSSGGISTVI